LILPTILLLIIFLAAGVSLKITDTTGERNRSVLSYLLAGLSGVLFGILISESKISSAIMLGIVIGVVASAKVNKPNLVFGLAIAIITAAICGLTIPTLWLFLVVMTFAFIDEMGHNRYSKLKSPLNWFFQYRCSLKVTIVFLMIMTVLPLVYGMGFLLFDAGYEATSALLDRLWPMPRFK